MTARRPARIPFAIPAVFLAVPFLCALAVATPPPAHADNVIATDGYFEVQRIDADTYSIHEPKYWQQNVMYVIKGEARSILFDTGSGTRNVAFIAGNVTKKPMTAVPSHVHYDHIGSQESFQHVAMIDLPETRAATSDNWYSPPLSKSLRPLTGGFHVTEWWKPGDIIDLGERSIEVVHIPGHSTDSVALVDRANHYAFVGDHLYGGALAAYLPGSDLTAYLHSTRKLLNDFPEIRSVFGAHEPGRLPRESLVALEKTLADIIEKRATGQRLWWLGWMVARYPGDGFTVLAAP